MGKKQLVITIIIITVGLITLVGLLFFNQDERTSWDGGERYDANSGETYSEQPEEKASEQSDSDPTTDSLAFLGLVWLTRGGATTSQLENTRNALSAFALDKGYEEISITKESATTYFDETDNAAGLDFKFIMDGEQTFYGRMHTVNLHDIQLLIYSDEARTTRVYDSGLVSTGPADS